MVKIVILGTMQDAGIPQLDCTCVNCRKIMEKGGSKYVSCIAVIGDHKAIIIDATPDLPNQYNYLKMQLGDLKIKMEGILLTHLHIGHYTGLIYVGRESANTRDFPVFLTAENFQFLKANKPFSYLFERKQIKENIFEPSTEILIDESFSVKPFLVPHRNEDGNTIGIEVLNKKNNSKAVYIPDIDYLPDSLFEKLKHANKVLFDGTFFEKTELMRQNEVPHPPISETIKIFGEQSPNKFYFIHLNHSNPVLNKESKEYKQLQSLHYIIPEEFQEIII